MKSRQILKGLRKDGFFRDNNLLVSAFSFIRIYHLIKIEKLSYFDITKEKIIDLIFKESIKNKEFNFQNDKHNNNIMRQLQLQQLNPNSHTHKLIMTNFYSNMLNNNPENLINSEYFFLKPVIPQRRKPINVIIDNSGKSKNNEESTSDAKTSDNSNNDNENDNQSTIDKNKEITLDAKSLKHSDNNAVSTVEQVNTFKETNFDMFKRFCDEQKINK